MCFFEQRGCLSTTGYECNNHYLRVVQSLKCASQRGDHKTVFDKNNWNAWHIFTVTVSAMICLVLLRMEKSVVLLLFCDKMFYE